MMRTRLFALSLVALLMLVTVGAAFAADEVALEIRNLTQTSVALRLSGPTDLRVTITRRFTVLRVEPGTYTYRYRACGLNQSGTFVVGTTGGSFLMKKCEKDINGTINVMNLTGKAFVLRLSGPKNYSFIIKPGDNKITLQAGRYGYTANVCGATDTGTHGIKSGKKSPEWRFDCD